MSKLNPKTLTIAAALLMVLALLFLATPLLRARGGFGGSVLSGQTPRGFTRQGTGQIPTPGAGQSDQGFGFQGQGDGTTQGQGFPSQGQTNPGFTTRQFSGQRRLLRVGFLNGTIGVLVYAAALLISLAAAVGMFMTKAWGRALGIVMAVLYALLALISLVPTLLIGAVARFVNPLNLGLNIAHLLLAVAVIVLASMRNKQPVETAPAPVAPPPAASA